MGEMEFLTKRRERSEIQRSCANGRSRSPARKRSRLFVLIELKSERGPFQSPPPVHLLQVVTTQQIAFERFNDGVDVPLGAIVVAHQFLDAVPLRRVVIFAVLAVIKKFTVLLTDVFVVFAAVLDFHFFSPFLPGAMG
jgi:hypothetical protein